MSSVLAKQAGTALVWRVIQLAGVKGIYLIRVLVLAWLLSPEHFGLLAIALIAIDVLLSLTDFGMVPALVQRSNVDDRHYDAAWTVGITRATAISLIAILAAPFIAGLFGEPDAAEVLRVLALRPLIDAAASIKVADLTRNLQFRSLALIALAEASTNTALSVGLAGMLGVWGLVAGVLGGAVAMMATSYIVAPYRPRLSFKLSAARPLINYGRWLLLTGVVALAGSAALQLVISRQLGTTELGVYYLAAKLAFVPYEASVQVFGSVAFPLFARLQFEPEQRAIAFRNVLTGMTMMLLPSYAVLIALAPSLVQGVLGPRWAGTAPIIQLLAVAGLLSLFSEVARPLLKGAGQPRKVLLLEAIQLLILVPLAWELAGRFGLVGAASAWLPAVLTSQLISIFLIRRLLHGHLALLGQPVLAIAVASAVGAVIAMSVNALVSGLGLLGLILATGLSLATMGILTWALNRRFALGLADNLLRVFPWVAIVRRRFRNEAVEDTQPENYATSKG